MMSIYETKKKKRKSIKPPRTPKKQYLTRMK